MGTFLTVAPVLGLIAMIMSLWHLLPATVSWLLDDGAVASFGLSMAINFGCGFGMWALTRKFRADLKPRDGAALVVLAWVGGAAFAMVPLLLVIPGLSITDAYFEAVSGLTASGGTVLVGLERLPPSINLWRGLLQWLGGLGVLVLAVAILPLLGVGGRQLYRAEMPGPMKDTKLTPRITETAKALWTVYAFLTVACIVAYHWAGMGWLDALIHACTTMGLGGFSSYDASIGHFDSVAIEAVAIIFMLIASINFATHYLAWTHRGFSPYRRDPEVRWFLLAVLGSSAVIALFLWVHGVYPDLAAALRYATFNTVSVASTTGYSTTDYSLWPYFAPLWVLFLGTFCACSGSTGGGIKMIRAVILYRQIYRELLRMLHPQAVVPLKIGGHAVSESVMLGVLGYFFIWIATLSIATLALAGSGLDLMTGFSAAVASLSNIGPGLHQVGPAANFAALSDAQTWICTATMLLGRLEILSVLVLFTPAFWRK